MKKAVLLIGLLVSMVSLSGCLEEQQGTSDQQPTWRYECPDGTLTEDPGLCTDSDPPAAGEVRKLLKKPLAEYALTQDDARAGHIKNEQLSRYYTLDELIETHGGLGGIYTSNETKKRAELILNGFKEYYEIGFQKGDPAEPESAISHKLSKYDNVEGAKQIYAENYEDLKALVKRKNKNGIVIAVLRIPTKGNESNASYTRFPSEMYQLTFRTKNVNHTIYLLSHAPVFSIEDALLYADKIIEKTKR